MNKNETTNLRFPSPVRTISILLLMLFCIEIVIMNALPYLLPIHNAYLENLADASLLALLFTPALYRLVFKPFQKIASQQKALTEKVLAHVVDGLITFDQSSAIRSCNGAAERIFGYGAAEIIGRDLNLILEARGLPELGGGAASRRQRVGPVPPWNAAAGARTAARFPLNCR